MPRRPRPASRKAPRGGTTAAASHDTSALKAPRSVHKRKPPSPEPQSDSEESEAFSDQPDDTDDDKEFEESDVDVDAPRVAQWVDEEDIDNLSGGDESEGSEDEEEDLGVGPSDLKGLRNDLSSLPLGALRKAQQTLSRAKVIDHSDSEEDQSGAEEPEEDWESGPEEQESGRPADRTDIAKKKEIEKRRNKHAPMEMTSKRPVPRKKIVIEEKRPVPRDPRFLPITGEFSADKFRTQYGFLSDLHETEMKTLKDNLKRARRMLASSPRDQRAEREAEVQRLERAVKRAESQVNRDKREKVEASALKRVRQEEKEKQKQGKRAWFMKDADKKELLVRAKFDALAESGGRGAVKKAIEKKQKKVSQKEKKKRPFAPGAAPGPRRPAHDAGGQRPHKRQKFA